MTKNVKRGGGTPPPKPIKKTVGKTDSIELIEEKKRLTINDVLKSKIVLKCKNTKQKELVNTINNFEVTIVTGVAGCGKTHVALARAIQLIQDTSSPYQTLILTKPVVEAEEQLGFIPGDLEEKLKPHMASFIDIIDDLIGENNRKRLVDLGIIKIEPLAFLRGKTLSNKIVIADEMQNASPTQLKTLMTRIGANSKYIISGDMDQSDRYKDYRKSGLYDVNKRYRVIEEIGFIEFDISNIVRNQLITKILSTYIEKNNDEEKQLIKG